MIVFEGRDGAGKGGVIKAITERVSPRVFRLVALPAPTEREKSQMYMQRYMQHFPAAGEIVIFDRSWYNRAGVERVLGFCTPAQHQLFLRQCPAFERMLIDDDRQRDRRHRGTRTQGAGLAGSQAGRRPPAL
jgi:polyphosphate kinase 2 (PPK2 family)